MQPSVYFSLAMAGVALIYILIGIFWGIRRGVGQSALRLATLAVCAVGAYFISFAVISACEPRLIEFIKGTLAKFLTGEFGDTLEASPSFPPYIAGIAAAMIAPLIYTATFFALRLITYLLYRILAAIFFKKKNKPEDEGGAVKRPGLLSRLLAIGLSVVGGLVIAFAILMPVTGYITLASEEYSTLVEAGIVKEESVPGIVTESLERAGGSVTAKAVRALGGDLVFDGLSTLHGEVSVHRQVTAVSKIVPAVKSLKEIPYGDLFDKEKEKPDLSPIRVDLVQVVEEDGTTEIRTIVAEILSFAGTRWSAGEAFFGVNFKEKLPATYINALDAALLRLAEAKENTVGNDIEDFATTADVVGDVVRYLGKVPEVETVSTDTLHSEMRTIIDQVTPGNASILAQAISAEMVGEAGLGGVNRSAVAEVISDTLAGIAQLAPGEERQNEAYAVADLLSVTSDARVRTMNEEEVVDSFLASDIVGGALCNYKNKHSGDKDFEPEIEVPKTQYDNIMRILGEKEAGATESQKNTIEAMRALIKYPAEQPQ